MEHGASPRQRAAILLSILVLHLLVFVLLLRQAPWQPPPKDERKLLVFQLAPETPTKVRPVKRTEAGGKTRPPPTHPPDAPPPPPLAEPVVTPNPSLLVLNKDAFASTDIGKMAKRPSGPPSGSGPAYGPGDGPGGAELQYADWFRRPTDAELATYLPTRAPTGSGTIACQTAPKYHVENCRVIGETPPGMGLAQAVRRAAWQFLVVPPRVNGQPLIGVWVRIRIDYTRVAARSGPSLPYPLPPPDPPEE